MQRDVWPYMTMLGSKALARWLVLVIGAMASQAQAYDFIPTTAEWITWPEFCRARYVSIPQGEAPRYKDTVDPGAIPRWSASLDTCWSSVHHYCAGVAKTTRSFSETQRNRRDFQFKSAESEFMYVREHCPVSNPFWSQNESQLALTQLAAGDAAAAAVTVEGAIKAHPDFGDAYIAKAKILKRQGKPQDARRALIAGHDATKGESAGLEYALGLSYFETREFELARQHAKLAYSLGYPLPSLSDKLRKVGFPIG